MFKSVKIFPEPVSNFHIINWEVTSSIEGFKYFVFRSETGNKPWILLNPEGTLSDSLIDPDVVYTRKDFPYYRLLAVKGDTKIESDVVSTLSLYKTNKEFGMVRKILKEEVKNMRARNGGIFHVFRRLKREFEPSYQDDFTKQELSKRFTTSSVTSNQDLGFSEAVTTYGTLSASATRATVRVLGTTDDVTQETGRFLDLPPIFPGDIIKRDATKALYVVEAVQPAYFKNLIPTTCNLTATMLDKKDIRHRLS